MPPFRSGLLLLGMSILYIENDVFVGNGGFLQTPVYEALRLFDQCYYQAIKEVLLLTVSYVIILDKLLAACQRTFVSNVLAYTLNGIDL